MNNRGFAITTFIYGLSILGIILISIVMATMSNTRTNSKKISDSVKEDLINFSNSSITYSYKNTEQTFITPDSESGWYRIELWGAQGNENNGGKGAYTTGLIYLTEGEQLYFYVGKNGGSEMGGGDTSVRVDSGDEEASLRSRIMVAGGGGSTPSAVGTTVDRYTISSTNDNLTSTENYTSASNIGVNPYTFNQTANSPKVGKGYYNGILIDDNHPTGGTSFISGYAGGIAFEKNDSNSSGMSYIRYPYTFTNTSNESILNYSDNNGKPYVFYDGMMLAGVRSGDGLAKISRVLKSNTNGLDNSLPRKNSKLNNVNTVTFCVDEGVDEENILDNTILYAVSNGILVKYTREAKAKDSNGLTCQPFSLLNTSDLDEIALINSDFFGKSIKKYYVSVNSSTLIASENYSRVISPNGIHISAYQPDYSLSGVTEGTYYIFPVTENSEVISTYTDNNSKGDQTKFAELSGENNQKWSITEIDCKLYKNKACPGNDISNKEYRIEDLANFNALTINGDENKAGNKVYAISPFNDLSRNDPQIWKPASLKDGTFVINSAVDKFSANDEDAPGGLKKDIDNNGLIISKEDETDIARFYFYKLDFTSN